MQSSLQRQDAQPGQPFRGSNIDPGSDEYSRLQQDIANLAYSLWQARGCPDGSAEQDWFEAEQTVRGV
jgi:hypothetical protein